MTWDANINQEISGNYYPVSSMIGIKDKNNPKEIL